MDSLSGVIGLYATKVARDVPEGTGERGRILAENAVFGEVCREVVTSPP
jgi:hypothetical protein